MKKIFYGTIIVVGIAAIFIFSGAARGQEGGAVGQSNFFSASVTFAPEQLALFLEASAKNASQEARSVPVPLRLPEEPVLQLTAQAGETIGVRVFCGGTIVADEVPCSERVSATIAVVGFASDGSQKILSVERGLETIIEHALYADRDYAIAAEIEYLPAEQLRPFISSIADILARQGISLGRPTIAPFFAPPSDAAKNGTDIVTPPLPAKDIERSQSTLAFEPEPKELAEEQIAVGDPCTTVDGVEGIIDEDRECQPITPAELPSDGDFCVDDNNNFGTIQDGVCVAEVELFTEPGASCITADGGEGVIDENEECQPLTSQEPCTALERAGDYMTSLFGGERKCVSPPGDNGGGMDIIQPNIVYFYDPDPDSAFPDASVAYDADVNALTVRVDFSALGMDVVLGTPERATLRAVISARKFAEIEGFLDDDAAVFMLGGDDLGKLSTDPFFMTITFESMFDGERFVSAFPLGIAQQGEEAPVEDVFFE